MNKNIINLVSKMDLNKSADEKEIMEVENRIGVKLPIQYKEFMLYSNGAEGELGENSYLVIWPIEEIISLNEAYSVNQYTPGILYFGSDGGDIETLHTHLILEMKTYQLLKFLLSQFILKMHNCAHMISMIL